MCLEGWALVSSSGLTPQETKQALFDAPLRIVAQVHGGILPGQGDRA
jgi:hypothetical protein